ncbi:unnamed protein product [Pleuronectes platessa]|uniref:Uncharacterized protein n=1 Tax=Pleuronectes platessa TaxID=8262 RepID=A0A9N7VNW0_PLEPL|nr:unnamed protein product [Pleuronectes platessa]
MYSVGVLHGFQTDDFLTVIASSRCSRIESLTAARQGERAREEEEEEEEGDILHFIRAAQRHRSDLPFQKETVHCTMLHASVLCCSPLRNIPQSSSSQDSGSPRLPRCPLRTRHRRQTVHGRAALSDRSHNLSDELQAKDT